MKATYSKQTGNYRITLTRKEAEALAYNFTSYSILLTALRTWRDSDPLDRKSTRLNSSHM